MSRSGTVLILLFVLAGTVLWPSQAFANVEPRGDVLNQLVKMFRGSVDVWVSALRPYGFQLFALLVGFEFFFAGVLWTLRGFRVDEILSELIFKSFVLGAMFFLLMKAPSFFDTLLSGFEHVGFEAAEAAVQSIPGSDWGWVKYSKTPSGIIDMGVDAGVLVLGMITKLGVASHLPTALFGALFIFSLIFCMIIVATQMTLLYVEYYLVTGTSVFLLAFGAFRGTAGIADGVIDYAFVTGLRLFAFLLVATTGLSFYVQIMISLVNSDQAWLAEDLLVLMMKLVAVSAALAALGIIIPNRLGSAMAGGGRGIFNIKGLLTEGISRA